MFNVQQKNELPTKKSFTVLTGGIPKKTYFDYFVGNFQCVDANNNLWFEFYTIHFDKLKPINTNVLSLSIPVEELDFSASVLNKIEHLKKGFNEFNLSISSHYEDKECLEKDLKNTFSSNLSFFFDEFLNLQYNIHFQHDVCLQGFESGKTYNLEELAIKLSSYMIGFMKKS